MTYAPQSKENSNPQHQQQSAKATAQTFSDERESSIATSPLQTMMANSSRQQKLKSTARLMANSPVQQRLNTRAQSFANKPEPVQRMEDEPLQAKLETGPAHPASVTKTQLNLLGNKEASVDYGVTQRNVIQRAISEDEKNQLTTAEGQIDTALTGSILGRRGIVNFTLPGFVQNEVQMARENIPDGSFGNLLLACQRYLAMVNRANSLAAVVEFERLVGTLGNTYQTYAGEKTVIRAQHQADNHGAFSGADPSDIRVGQVDTKIKALNGKILEREGTTLQDTIAGGVERNRQAGAEVTSVHNMLSLMMLEVKKTTGVYKSPHDEGVGHLGAEWSIKAGATSNFPRAKEKAETLSKNWVLHGHVANVRGNKFSKKISNVDADHFHLKDKDTADGPDGPSVVVNSGDVRAQAEASLKNYMEQINDRNNTWKGWIEKEYIQPDT